MIDTAVIAVNAKTGDLWIKLYTSGLELKATVGDWLIRELELIVLSRRSNTGVFFVVSVVFLKNAECALVDFGFLVGLQKFDLVEA